jgi:hypothetical protein
MAIESVEKRSRSRVEIVGALHKGAAQVEGQKGIPEDLDLFRFTSKSPAVVDAFIRAYGSLEVPFFEIFLPFRELYRNWDYFFETWGGGARGKAGVLKMRCNGRDQIYWTKPDGSVSKEPRPCPICAAIKEGRDPGLKRGEHAYTGRLVMFLPRLLHELAKEGIAGAVMLTTHSITDIYRINAGIMAVQDQLNGSTDLRGVPFNLSRVYAEIPTAEHGVMRKFFVDVSGTADWLLERIGAAGSTGKPMVVDVSTGELVEDDSDPDGYIADYDDDPNGEPYDHSTDPDAYRAEQREAAQAKAKALAQAAAEENVHWTKIAAKQAAFKKLAGDLGLTGEDIKAVLQVDRVGHFGGSYEQTVFALDLAAEAKRKGIPIQKLHEIFGEGYFYDPTGKGREAVLPKTDEELADALADASVLMDTFLDSANGVEGVEEIAM